MTIPLSLSDPETLVASLPYLLGFEPHESAVAVWLDGRRIVVAQRIDLPDDPRDPQWHGLLWGHAGVARADGLIVVLVSQRDDLAALTDPILERAAGLGVTVLDVMAVDGDRWRSLLCTDRQCCPSEGRVVRSETRTRVAAEFAWAGVASAGTRSDVVAALARDAELVGHALAGLAGGAAASADEESVEAWRDGAIALLIRILQGRVDAADPSSVAMVLTGLADIRVRDTILWTASHWSGVRLAVAVDALATAVRSAPEGHLAPVGTVFAGLAWLAGDGARAGIVLDRVRDEQPDYALAGLLATAVSGGLSPDAWRIALQSLTRSECRHGCGSLTTKPARL